MLEIGKITKKTASVSSIMKMETNTKEDGKIIKDMAKEHSGSVMPKINSGDNIQEIGKMISKKEGEPCFSRVEIDTMACGWIVNPMDKAE